MTEEELLALLSGTRKTPVRVCRIPQALAGLIGALTTSVWLSHNTICKQESKHHSPSLKPYLLAPTIISKGYRRIQPPKHLVFIHHIRNGKIRSWRATVKATNDGRELYLVSVHRQRKSDVRATYKRTLSIKEFKARREVGPPTNPT